ncbi:MAG: hypothetical protein R3C52_02065 [Hyphomonadaceae bacterium]
MVNSPELSTGAEPGVPDLLVRRGASASSATGAADAAAVSRRPIVWALSLLIVLAAVSLIGREILRTYSVTMAQSASDAQAEKLLVQTPPVGAPAAYYQILSELAQRAAPNDPEAGLAAAKAAVERDPTLAHAWASIAYGAAAHAGGVDEEAATALENSMNLCPLCDTDLVAWRFEFVLANWDTIPERLRLKAFDQADILRWSGDHAEFLAEMRVKAEAAGIPYVAYLSQVDSPVPALETGYAGVTAPATTP